MLTYVIGVAFLRGVVLGSRTMDELPGMIRSGDLAKWLLRPVGMFKSFFARDMVAKLLDILFVTGEVFLVVKLLNLEFYFPHQPATYFAFLFILFVAIILYFFMALVIGAFGFWTEDTWATRWLFGLVFLEFLAGVYFPLDVLPQWLVTITKFTPFPYLIYFPIRVWNQQVSGLESFQVILVLLLWTGFFWYLAAKLWKRGLKHYGVYGG